MSEAIGKLSGIATATTDRKFSPMSIDAPLAVMVPGRQCNQHREHQKSQYNETTHPNPPHKGSHLLGRSRRDATEL